MTTLRDKIHDVVFEDAKGFDEFTRDQTGAETYANELTDKIIEVIRLELEKQLS